MVFLECAMFVSKLRTQELPSAWVTHNNESNFPMMHSVSHNLKKWGDAIAEKLRLTELRERELMNRFGLSGKDSSKGDSPGSSCVLSEEPVFPVDHEQLIKSKDGEEQMYQLVSYAVKMSACMLLLEITRFMRDPPPQFSATSASQVNSPRMSSVMEPDRKPSSASLVSDADSFKTGCLSGRGFTSSPAPNIGRFGSTLSVEDPDPPPSLKNSVSMDEGGSPVYRKKRVSVYLHVGGSAGAMSRTNSLRRQPKAVHVTESSRSSLHPSPTVRTRRTTIVHSPASNLPHGTGIHRPSVAITNPVPISYRRKSLGTAFFKQGLSLESDHHPAPLSEVPGGSSKPHGAGASLFGTSLNVGFTKLKRAFTKRLPTKPRAPTESGSSPSGSPGFKRKVMTTGPRISLAGSFYSQPGSPEDRGFHCQWLSIVEHLIVVESSYPLVVRHRHRVSCKGLINAFKKVYSSVFEIDEDSAPKELKYSFAPSRSISVMFAPKLVQMGVSEDGGTGGTMSYKRGLSLPNTVTRRVSRKSNLSVTNRSTSMPFSSSKTLSLASRGSSSAVSAINFSQLNHTKFSNTFFGAMCQKNEESIALQMEAESAYPMYFLDAQADSQKREYVMSELLGLVHIPFSILVHAAPILHHSTFSNLKGLAWDSLLDDDTELAQSAGRFIFYLFVCVCAHTCVHLYVYVFVCVYRIGL